LGAGYIPRRAGDMVLTAAYADVAGKERPDTLAAQAQLVDDAFQPLRVAGRQPRPRLEQLRCRRGDEGKEDRTVVAVMDSSGHRGRVLRGRRLAAEEEGVDAR